MSIETEANVQAIKGSQPKTDNPARTAKLKQSSVHTHTQLEAIKIFSLIPIRDTNHFKCNTQESRGYHPDTKESRKVYGKKGVWQESREPVCDQDSLFEIKIGRLRSRPR